MAVGDQVVQAADVPTVIVEPLPERSCDTPHAVVQDRVVHLDVAALDARAQTIGTGLRLGSEALYGEGASRRREGCNALVVGLRFRSTIP
jgi:hypothetical protein